MQWGLYFSDTNFTKKNMANALSVVEAIMELDYFGGLNQLVEYHRKNVCDSCIFCLR